MIGLTGESGEQWKRIKLCKQIKRRIRLLIKDKNLNHCNVYLSAIGLPVLSWWHPGAFLFSWTSRWLAWVGSLVKMIIMWLIMVYIILFYDVKNDWPNDELKRTKCELPFCHWTGRGFVMTSWSRSLLLNQQVVGSSGNSGEKWQSKHLINWNNYQSIKQFIYLPLSAGTGFGWVRACWGFWLFLNQQMIGSSGESGKQWQRNKLGNPLVRLIISWLTN